MVRSAKPIILGCVAILASIVAARGGNQISMMAPAFGASLHNRIGIAPNPPPRINASHIQTGDFLGGSLGTHSITWDQAAPFLTWAMTDKYTAGAISKAGMKTVFYSD